MIAIFLALLGARLNPGSTRHVMVASSSPRHVMVASSSPRMPKYWPALARQIPKGVRDEVESAFAETLEAKDAQLKRNDILLEKLLKAKDGQLEAKDAQLKRNDILLRSCSRRRMGSSRRRTRG